MILIIGAGLAGLSAAYYLGHREYEICEKDHEVGGLCRSYRADGFTFDYTGHLMHVRRQETMNLLETLLPQAFTLHRRRASIYAQGVFTPYPFQANLYKLPREVIKECLVGFIKAVEQRSTANTFGSKTLSNNEAASFKDWIIGAFGKGIANYFMLPYNEKLWQTDLSSLSSDWVEWSIPVPSVDEVVGGALGIENEQMGYSAQFYYPGEGGIGVLPRSFLPHINEVKCGKQLTALDLKEKRAWFSDGSTQCYSALVSTAPLTELLGMIRRLPPEIAAIKSNLKHISVLDINLGINRDALSDQHWIYFPERDFPFYRAGCYSNFSAATAPAGTTSLYIEVSYLPGTLLDKQGIINAAFQSLSRCGILIDQDQILAQSAVELPYAYVIYDSFRKDHLPRVMDYLARNSVWSIGRYGSWKYMSMEDTILEGKAVAEALGG